MQRDMKVGPLLKKINAELKQDFKPGPGKTFTTPNSAYVGGEDNAPRHPQTDKKDVFEEGMFLAIVPKGADKPKPKDTTVMETVRGTMRS